MAALDDHGDSSYAQDLDGMWHRRRGSSWTPPPAGVQCVTECGRRIASVHVAESDPRLRGLSVDEWACEICLPNPPKET
jgi:hypothetical protein